MTVSNDRAQQALAILEALTDFLEVAQFSHDAEDNESNFCYECGVVAYRCKVPPHADDCAVARALEFLKKDTK